MKKALDKFSKQSSSYKKFRPTYPNELFDYILSFCSHKNSALDCGTGNGQVALELSKVFDEVYATDLSESQILKADYKDNIRYRVSRAEKTNFKAQTFDLITVAQAIHWFDVPEFNKEARRLLKPDGILAIWGYGLLQVDPAVNEIMVDFYKNTVGSFWDKERKHIDDAYQSISLDLEELKVSQEFQIRVTWNLYQMEGYLNSWSSVQNFIRQRGTNPVNAFIKELSSVWGTTTKDIHFPIFLRILKKEDKT